LEDGDTLLCSHCRKPCGAQVQSSISISSCESRTFSNSAGHLICDEPALSNSDNIPLGTYSNSCNGCSVTEEILSCSQCRSPDGLLHASQVNFSNCEGIENDNGILLCRVAEKKEVVIEKEVKVVVEEEAKHQDL